MDTDLRARLIGNFRWLDPGPQTTHLVSDVSGWWRDPVVLAGIGPALADLFAGQGVTVVASPEITGLLLGPLVATALSAGFVEAYKDTTDRRVPDEVLWGRSAVDYRGRTLNLGVRAARLGPRDRVLIVDDWVVTGAQIGALRAALEQAAATVVGAAVIVDGCAAATGAALGVRGLLRPRDLPTPPPS